MVSVKNVHAIEGDLDAIIVIDIIFVVISICCSKLTKSSCNQNSSS
jgi:hypothetical protein